MSVNITQGLRRALQINPQGIAILEGERKLTWAEVGERVSRLAGALRLMLNSSRYLELYLAAGWAGAVIVPLNIRWSVAENQDALQDSGTRLLVVDNAFQEAGRTFAAAISALGGAGQGCDLVECPQHGPAQYRPLKFASGAPASASRACKRGTSRIAPIATMNTAATLRKTPTSRPIE